MGKNFHDGDAAAQQDLMQPREFWQNVHIRHGGRFDAQQLGAPGHTRVCQCGRDAWHLITVELLSGDKPAPARPQQQAVARREAVRLNTQVCDLE
jgi:hypothetical protein